MLRACFVRVLSVLYTVSVLILQGINISSFSLVPCKVLISQNVVLVSKSKRRVCVLRTCLDLRLNEKEKKKGGGISTFTLLNYEMICGFAQVQVSFHH